MFFLIVFEISFDRNEQEVVLVLPFACLLEFGLEFNQRVVHQFAEERNLGL